MVAERGYQVIEDAGRGYRRVVASPKPKAVIELDTIRALVDSDHIVVACGGGGIPVFTTEGHHLKGAAAVIDKDFASEVLAEQLDADYLIILTAVEKGRHQLRQAGAEVAGHHHGGRGRTVLL